MWDRQLLARRALASLIVILLPILAAAVLLPQQFDSLSSPLLTRSIRQHLQVVAGDIADEVGPVIGVSWDIQLERLDRLHDVTFVVYDGQGARLAGAHSDPPLPVRQELAKTARLVAAELPTAYAGSAGTARDHLREARAQLLPLMFLYHGAGAIPYWVGIRTLLPHADGGWEPATVLAASPSLWGALSFLGVHPWVYALALVVFVCATLWAPLLHSLHTAPRYFAQALRVLQSMRADEPKPPLRRGELRQMAASLSLAAERLRESEHSQGQFVLDLAHEVRGTLARVQVAFEIVEDQTPAWNPQLGADVHAALQQFSALASGLMAYWQARQAEGKPPLVPLPLGEVVHSAVALERASGQVTQQVPPELIVWSNGHPLEHAIGNLIRNALTHAGAVGGPVELEAQADGDKVRLRVMDRGPGVPDSILLNLGKPFVRASKQPGTGLGLAIVKDCVSACHGSVLFRNREGGGFEAEVVLQSAGLPRSQPVVPAPWLCSARHRTRRT